MFWGELHEYFHILEGDKLLQETTICVFSLRGSSESKQK